MRRENDLAEEVRMTVRMRDVLSGEARVRAAERASGILYAIHTLGLVTPGEFTHLAGVLAGMKKEAV